MKKLVYILLVVISVFTLLSVEIWAEENFTDKETSKYTSSIFNSLSDETKDILTSSGLDSVDVVKLNNLSPKDIFTFAENIISSKISDPLKLFLRTLLIVMVVGFVSVYISDNERKNFFNIITIFIVTVVVSPTLFSVLKASAAQIDSSCKFMYMFLPVMAGLVASCKNPALAISFNSVSIYLAQIIGYITENILLPFIGIFYSFTTLSSFSKEIDLKGFVQIIKSAITKSLMIMSSFYVAFISLKGILANDIDTLVSKGTKLIVSNAIPFIGGNLSDIYGSVITSLTLIKSTVGIFGIIAISAINLPIIVEVFLYTVSFTFLSAICKVLNLDCVGEYLSGISYVLKTLNVLIIFTAVLFIISTGILISLRGVS